MSKTISYSQKSIYEQCSYKYYLHYEKKLRTKYIDSSLFFGSNLDKAFNSILLAIKNKEDLFVNCNEKLNQIKDDFKNDMKNLKSIDNNLVCPITYQFLRYSKNDVDLNLFDFKEISKKEEVKEFLKSFSYKKSSEYDVLRFNRLAHNSLIRKGVLIIENYANFVNKHIAEVISIQEEVNIKNDDGDIIKGFIDFICTFKDDLETVYIVDNKTSSKKYSKESFNSDQLKLYSYYKQIPNVCFIVIDKNIKTIKKTGEKVVNIEILKHKYEDNHECVIDKFDNFLTNIKNKNFKKHTDKNKCIHYNKVCDYFQYCHFGKKSKHLIQIEDKKLK